MPVDEAVSQPLFSRVGSNLPRHPLPCAKCYAVQQQLPPSLIAMISLQLQRPSAVHAATGPLYLLRFTPPSRSQFFSVRISIIHQTRIARCFSFTKGGNLQEWNEDSIIENQCSKTSWWNLAHKSGNHMFSLVSSRIIKLGSLKGKSRLDKQPIDIFVQVLAGLLGAAFFLFKLRSEDGKTVLINIRAFSLWFMGTFKRGQLQAIPLHIGQFGAITLAFNNPSSTFNFTMPSPGVLNEQITRFSYILDILLERHPISYILLLMSVCFTLIFIGGVLFSKCRSYTQKPGDSFWDAWACLCSSSTHLKEKTSLERGIGLMLALGGIFFYSLLTSTMTAQFKTRMEMLREGAHSEVMEEGHVVICGTNNHLIAVLKQLNKSQQLALREGLTKKLKQTVLILSENERIVTEKLVANELKNLLQLNILTRRSYQQLYGITQPFAW